MQDLDSYTYGHIPFLKNMNDPVIQLHLSAIAITLPRPIRYKYHTLKHFHSETLISLTYIIMVKLQMRYRHAL